MVATVNEHEPEVKNTAPYWSISSDKFNHTFYVKKSFDGFVFFQVTIDKGTLPDKLKGFYTKPQEAIKAVLAYEHEAKPTATVQRDRKAAKRTAQKEES